MPYAKDEKRKQEQVTTQPVQVRKKSRGRQFKEALINEDARNIKEFIIYDLGRDRLLPALKEGFLKASNSILEMMLFGKDSNRSKGSGNTTYVSYSSYSNRQNAPYRTSRRTVEYDDIIFPSRVEAEHVLDTMIGITEQYGQATIADYYDCCGVTGRGYTDNDFGWVDLRGARIVRRAGGWTIDLPRAIDLK